MQFRFQTLDRFPRAFTVNRKKSLFQAGYADTVEKLSRELAQLGVKDFPRECQPVIQIAIEPRWIRRDGLPNAAMPEPAHPGVVLLFQVSKRQKDQATGRLVDVATEYSFVCDEYPDWKSNLRAIALTLEALRDVERWGATKGGQQYEGYAIPLAAGDAPPAPGSMPEERQHRRVPTEISTVEAAARFISENSEKDGLETRVGAIIQIPEAFTQAYRIAAGKLHPDAGGSHQEFVLLQDAARLMREHHRLVS